jgi:hypothetical protein
MTIYIQAKDLQIGDLFKGMEIIRIYRSDGSTFLKFANGGNFVLQDTIEISIERKTAVILYYRIGIK